MGGTGGMLTALSGAVRRGRWLAASAWAAASLLVAACSANPPGTGVASSPLAPAEPAQRGTPVKVALIASISAQGQPGLIGKALKGAAELALFDRDSANLQLLVKDDKATPEGAAAAATEAIKEGASLILGPLFAKSVAAVAPIARQANVPVVAFSNDRQVAGHGVYLLSFQPGPEIARVVQYATQQGKRRFAALVPDDAFGRLAGSAFKEAVERAGGAVIVLETYPASANGMLEPMRKVSLVLSAAADSEEGRIDALFLPGGQDNVDRIARLMPQAEIDPSTLKVIGTGGMDYTGAGHNAGLLGAWYPGPDPRGWEEFAQKFAKSYGQAPPRIASLAYDAMSLAVVLADGGEARYAPAQLTRPGGFLGVDGPYRFLADGTADRAQAILEVHEIGAGIIDPAPPLGSIAPLSGVRSAAPGLAAAPFDAYNN